jgi:hypothetical protein
VTQTKSFFMISILGLTRLTPPGRSVDL